MSQQFRKKPVVIDAMLWDGSVGSANAIVKWIGDGARFHQGTGGEQIAIPTLEGVMSARSGDWIIRGVQGEFYLCKPDIFSATYEAV